MESTYKPQKLKPIEIDLIAGNVQLTTHAGNTILVEMGKPKGKLMPSVHETDDQISISGQSLFAFLLQTERADIKITVPDNANVRVKQGAGNLTIHGYYDHINAKVNFGDIKVELADFNLTKDANFRAFAGDVDFNIENECEKGAVMKLKKEKHLKFEMKAGGKVNAKSFLGETKIQPHHKKYKKPQQVFATLTMF